jgi:hypothetical protein
MALYDPEMPCPLCDQPVGDDQSAIICFPCVGITNPRYEMLDDSCAHAECLRAWKKRDRFVVVFNEAMGQTPNQLPYHLAVDPSGYLRWVGGPMDADA